MASQQLLYKQDEHHCHCILPIIRQLIRNQHLGMPGLLLLILPGDGIPLEASDGEPLPPLLILQVRGPKFFFQVFLVSPCLDPKVNYLQLTKILSLLLTLSVHQVKLVVQSSFFYLLHVPLNLFLSSLLNQFHLQKLCLANDISLVQTKL